MSVSQRRSREGIAWEEYRWGMLLLSLLPGLLFAAFVRLYSCLIREAEPVGDFPFPKGALVVVFHPEFLITLSSRRVWNQFCRPMAYLGSHTFASYVTSWICYFDGLPCVRYDRNKPGRPIDRVRDFLRDHPEKLFAFRTDSGGPYGRVRPSAAGLAISMNRPIVCMRQTASRAGYVLQHAVPLPFSKTMTYFSSPISPATLAKLSNEEATRLIQETMDGLVPPPPLLHK